jgi:hypothetical protein
MNEMKTCTVCTETKALFEFGKDKELLSQFFLLAKSKWNDKHDITIKGYDVEVYAE